MLLHENKRYGLSGSSSALTHTVTFSFWFLLPFFLCSILSFSLSFPFLSFPFLSTDSIMDEANPLLQVVDQLQTSKTPRVASLDVFRGLCVFLMMVVDYGGAILPILTHSPWNGLQLADLVMPFFLFIAGVSLALMYKRVPNRLEATWKAMFRAVKLFFLGILLQGGYFHGINTLTYGVDIEKIRWLGILQRISIGYIAAALCEIWLSCRIPRTGNFYKNYCWHWCGALLLSVVYLWLLHGLYVPDWQFEISSLTFSVLPINDTSVYMVKCSVRGDLGPGCNSAGMIDRYLLGLDHLYRKPCYRNLKECNVSSRGHVPENLPAWCHAPFDPEGLLSSLPAAVTCIIGLQYGHILAHIQDHKGRLKKWSIFSAPLLVLGFLLTFMGIPVNKSLYTFSYTLLTAAIAGITYCLIYLLVDVRGHKHLFSILEWMGKHSLSIFVVVSTNLAVIAIQGFYIAAPQNNLIHWIVSCFVHR